MSRKLTNVDIDSRLVSTNIIRLEDSKGGRTKIKFKCILDDYEWMSTPSNILHNGNGCARCSKHEPITNLNLDMRLVGRSLIRIEDVSHTKMKIKFRCEVDGHEWYATANSILDGNGCPKCAKHEICTNKYIDDNLRNRPIIRIGDSQGSTIKITFKCAIDNYQWNALPSNIIRGSGCPSCKNKNESRIYTHLSTFYNYDISRHHTITTNDRKYIIDFLVDNKFIEYNGRQHYEPVLQFGGEKSFIAQQIRDQEVRSYCNDNNIPFLEIPYYLTYQEQYTLIRIFLGFPK